MLNQPFSLIVRNDGVARMCKEGENYFRQTVKHRQANSTTYF